MKQTKGPHPVRLCKEYKLARVSVEVGAKPLPILLQSQQLLQVGNVPPMLSERSQQPTRVRPTLAAGVPTVEFQYAGVVWSHVPALVCNGVGQLNVCLSFGNVLAA